MNKPVNFTKMVLAIASKITGFGLMLASLSLFFAFGMVGMAFVTFAAGAALASVPVPD